jgi:hypothetical protein
MNSEEEKQWFVVLTAPAQKHLERVPPRDLARIYAAIEGMRENPLKVMSASCTEVSKGSSDGSGTGVSFSMSTQPKLKW